MKKLFFSGHSYHQKTKSSEFFIDFLKEYYDVTVHFNNTWETGDVYNINLVTNDYDIVIFWQLIPSIDIFKDLKHKNIIFFPMYDGVSRDFNWWYQYKNIKIVSFSKTLHNLLEKWGFNSFYIQYFIKPQEYNPIINNEVFLWQRRENINVTTVLRLFENKDIKLHVHKALDPEHNFTQPTKERERKYNITYSTWFDTKEEMQNLIKSKTFYIAPREEEGIGMTFLEAMAMGKIVIANNKPTMNEYIKDGYNGFLFDLKNPKPIEIKNIEQISSNVQTYITEGYNSWEKNKYSIINFLNSEARKHKTTIYSCTYYLKQQKKRVRKVVVLILIKLKIITKKTKKYLKVALQFLKILSISETDEIKELKILGLVIKRRIK